MLKQIRVNKDDKILFCSDFHLGHNRDFLYGKRGFDFIQTHDQWIKDQWDKHVDEDTIVFDLGDQTFHDGKGERFRDLSTWKCKEHYVLYGNHLSGYKQNYAEALEKEYGLDDVEVYPLKHNNITFVGGSCTIKIGRQFIVCNHFNQRIWDAMTGVPPVIHLSGHSHGNDLERLPECVKVKSMDVGVEVAKKYNGTPFFSLDEILEIMENKEVVVTDHHDKTTSYAL